VTVVNGIRLVSNSEVQTAKDCWRKWWLAWYRGLVPRAVSVEGIRSTGSRIHDALKVHYVPDGEQPQNPLTALKFLQLEDYETFLNSFDVDTPIDGDRAKKLNSQFDLEQAMIEGYVEWLKESGEDADLEIIDSEQYVEVPIYQTWMAKEVWGTPVKLIGKIDTRTRHRVTGVRRFIDHKTVQTLIDPTLKLNQQMLHYHVIEDLLTPLGGDRCDGALYNMLRKVKRTVSAKPPFFARVPIPHNRFEIQNYRLQLESMISEIVYREKLLSQGVPHHYAVPSRPSRDCSWKCDFFKICSLFDDGSRVEAAIDDLYQIGDPLKHYGGQEKGSDDN
jgi:hypothetical protein